MPKTISDYQMREYVRREWPIATAAAMRFIRAQGHDIKIVPNDPILARKDEAVYKRHYVRS